MFRDKETIKRIKLIIPNMFALLISTSKVCLFNPFSTPIIKKFFNKKFFLCVRIIKSGSSIIIKMFERYKTVYKDVNLLSIFSRYPRVLSE